MRFTLISSRIKRNNAEFVFFLDILINCDANENVFLESYTSFHIKFLYSILQR